MTTKYHISPTTGNPNRCYADKRPCPLGGEQEHYPTKEAAKAAFEAKHAGETVAKSVSKGLSKQEKLSALYQERKTWGEFPTDPSLRELQIAAARAKEKNSFVPVGFKTLSLDEPMRLEQDYDGTGSDWALVEQRDYLVATPDGGFVHVQQAASVSAEIDNGWEFYPTAKVDTKYFASAAEAEGALSRPLEGYDYVEVDDNEVFSNDAPSSYGFGYSRSARYGWDKWDEQSVRSACRTGMSKLPQPYAVARAMRLRHSQAKIDGKVLMGKNYLGSEDERVRRATAGRRELPREAHETLLQDSDLRVRGALAKRSDLSQATVKALLEQKEGHYDAPAPRQLVLMNPVISPTVAKKVAREGELDDLRALAKNPALPAEARETIKKRTESLGFRLFPG